MWWEHKGKSVSEIPDLPDEGIHHVGLGILTNMVPGGGHQGRLWDRARVRELRPEKAW